MSNKSQVILSYADICRYCPSDWNRRIISDSNLNVSNFSRIFTFCALLAGKEQFQPAVCWLSRLCVEPCYCMVKCLWVSDENKK